VKVKVKVKVCIVCDANRTPYHSILHTDVATTGGPAKTAYCFLDPISKKSLSFYTGMSFSVAKKVCEVLSSFRKKKI
jgi:hypothetical protein